MCVAAFAIEVDSDRGAGPVLLMGRWWGRTVFVSVAVEVCHAHNTMPPFNHAKNCKQMSR